MSRKTLFLILLVQCSKLPVQSRNGHRPHPYQPGQMKYMMGGRKTTKTPYNPNYGYEPYWENGDWVFKDVLLPPNVTTTAVPLVCGEECLDLYTPIGEVCGRQVNNLKYVGCKPTVVSWYCAGYNMDELSEGFRTFDTYCKFLDAQCRTSFVDKWIFVHAGRCLTPQRQIYKPISEAPVIITRMIFDLTFLAAKFDNFTIPHTILDTTTRSYRPPETK